MRNITTGYLVGTAAAINVELGWVPDRVELVNLTDGTIAYIEFPNIKTMAYTSGGSGTVASQIKPGMTIVGATSGATAYVKAVVNDTGTWGGANAAGWLVLDALSITGTFSSENIYIQGGPNTSGKVDAVGAAVAAQGVKCDTAFASDTNLTSYAGAVAATSSGFTIASGVSTNHKLFAYTAMRS